MYLLSKWESKEDDLRVEILKKRNALRLAVVRENHNLSSDTLVRIVREISQHSAQLMRSA